MMMRNIFCEMDLMETIEMMIKFDDIIHMMFKWRT